MELRENSVKLATAPDTEIFCKIQRRRETPVASQARRQGGAMGTHSPPPPPHRGRKGPPGKTQRRKKRTPKMNLSFKFANERCFLQCINHTLGCWSLSITVHVIDQYMSRPINGPNTIMRKSRLAVAFLDSVFLKTLKLHSPVKSLLKTSILI